MNQHRPARKSPAQQTFTTLVCAYLVLGVLAFFAWLYELPYVWPFVSWLTDCFSPLISPLIYKFLHFNNLNLEVAVTLGVFIFVALLISIPFLPIVESRLIFGRLRTGERLGIRVQKIRTKAKSNPKADNTAR
jgi:hypothetical protein